MKMWKSDGQAWSSSSPVIRRGRSEASITLNSAVGHRRKRARQKTGSEDVRTASEIPI